MKLRTRFMLTIGGVALLLVLPAAYAAQALRGLSQIATEVSATHGAAYLAMGRLQARMAEINSLERAHVAFPDPEAAARRDSVIVRARVHAGTLSSSGYEDLGDRTATLLDRIEGEARRNDGLAAAGLSQEATDRLPTVWARLFVEADSLLADLGTEIDRRSSADLVRASRTSAAALTTTLLALVASIFIAILLGTWATQTVVLPILRLSRGMAAVSAGEFVVPANLPYDRDDELGDLSRSFRSMTHQLADLDRMKADFMSVATHELKTPINVISGYAELLNEGVYGRISDSQQGALTSIQEQARILTQLVNQLLDISRLEAGGLGLEIGDTNVAELFERIRRTFEVLAHKQNIDFNVELEPGHPETIPADGDRLRDQVLGNLLGNALKFTPEGGRIAIRGWSKRSRFLIEVSDTGSGMPAELLPHVFDKYFQIGEQARSKGAGLGLAIAHEVVTGHGGSISVQSEEGRGTTFHIDLPATEREQAAALRAQETAAVGES